MTNAGKAGIPQIIAPACYDLVDLIGWQDIPPHFQDRESHAHNRLITSIVLNDDERRQVAREFNERLAGAQGKTTTSCRPKAATNGTEKAHRYTTNRGWTPLFRKRERPAPKM